MCYRQVIRISCLGCESVVFFYILLLITKYMSCISLLSLYFFLTCWRCYQFRIRQRLTVNEVRGYIVSSCLTCLSVCLSVWFPSVDMILSMHVLRNMSIDFSEKLYISNSTSENVHLAFSYWLVNFSSFYRLYSVFGLSHSLLWIKIVFKMLKNFDLNIKNELFLYWNCVFPILNINIWRVVLIYIL